LRLAAGGAGGVSGRRWIVARRARKLAAMSYRHVLVAYDGTPEADAAVLAAAALARRDGSRLTVAAVVDLERPSRRITRLPMNTSVWNDVLLDEARADLERAERLLDVPAERTVLFGSQARALADGADEFGCDAIMMPARPRGPLARTLLARRAWAIRRRTTCAVLEPR
jgi:nucleotide-binding universal stress UspA family protein